MASQQRQQQQSVSVDDIPLEQLAQIKKQLDEEFDILTNSFTALKQAEAKFKQAMSCLNSIKPGLASKQDMLVPLTASLYVPGSLKDAENVLVDVGTGYYVEKNIKQAKTYYNQKILELRKNSDNVTKALETKRDNRQMIVNALQRRAAAQAQSERAKAVKS